MIYLSYLAIYLIWGSTYYFIAEAVETIPPSWILAIRWSMGGLFFLLLSLIKNKGKLHASKKNILSSVLIGFLLLIGGNGLVTIAEKTIDSYIAALLISTVPLVVSLFNFFLFRIRISFLQLFGVVTGFCGVALLLYNGDSSSFELSPAVLLVMAGICSWALGTTLGARLSVSKDIFLNSSIQMITAAVLSTVTAFRTTENIPELFSSFSSKSVLSLLYLIVFGSLAIGAFNYLIRNEPSIRLTSYALVNPVIATLIGIFIGGEEVRSFLFAGLPLIITGLGIMIYGDKLKKNFRNREKKRSLPGND